MVTGCLSLLHVFNTPVWPLSPGVVAIGGQRGPSRSSAVTAHTRHMAERGPWPVLGAQPRNVSVTSWRTGKGESGQKARVLDRTVVRAPLVSAPGSPVVT